jgi:hypothetical protein
MLFYRYIVIPYHKNAGALGCRLSRVSQISFRPFLHTRERSKFRIPRKKPQALIFLFLHGTQPKGYWQVHRL